MRRCTPAGRRTSVYTRSRLWGITKPTRHAGAPPRQKHGHAQRQPPLRAFIISRTLRTPTRPRRALCLLSTPPLPIRDTPQSCPSRCRNTSPARTRTVLGRTRPAPTATRTHPRTSRAAHPSRRYTLSGQQLPHMRPGRRRCHPRLRARPRARPPLFPRRGQSRRDRSAASRALTGARNLLLRTRPIPPPAGPRALPPLLVAPLAPARQVSPRTPRRMSRRRSRKSGSARTRTSSRCSTRCAIVSLKSTQLLT
jgi:hypothetical protein